MSHKQNRRQLRTQQGVDARQVMPDINRVMNIDLSERVAEGGHELADAHNDQENSAILLAACRIVISGYKAEISRGLHDSVFVRAAYQLLHHFLERQFKNNSQAA